VPAIASLTRLEFESAVTFFAGENGTGKSTLLEAIASGAKSPGVRGGDRRTETTLEHATLLAADFRFEWKKRARHGFFLRAEDFFDYGKRMADLADELAGFADDFEERFQGWGRDLARGAVLGQRASLIDQYEGDLNARSHGESFLQFFTARFSRPGLYLLDEPDTALSPQSMLALLAMLKSLVREGSQFIIATHSPMLLAFPGAQILSFDASPVEPIAYNDVPGVALLRDFLSAPEAFFRRL
jgi:predicted ATPase